MTIHTPVIVGMASLAIVLIVIELVSVFLYPPRILMFDPSVFMV
jgi:hypothetical protein